MTPRATRLLLTTLLLSACGGQGGSSGFGQEGGVERAAVRPAGDGRDEALATGLLRADPKSGCLWLELEDGSAGTQLLLYGDAYRVNFGATPPEVLDGDDVVGRVGEQVEVGGGFGTNEGVPGCPVPSPVFHGYFD
jgi:hypothetical protein